MCTGDHNELLCDIGDCDEWETAKTVCICVRGAEVTHQQMNRILHETTTLHSLVHSKEYITILALACADVLSALNRYLDFVWEITMVVKYDCDESRYPTMLPRSACYLDWHEILYYGLSLPAVLMLLCVSVDRLIAVSVR